MALFDANVDLNPHQIEAALFALRSPVSKGVILADEVGLGKTIEASLVLCQLWAERKRKLLVICPASIRKQWANELDEKFNLPSILLDARAYNLAKKAGSISPFDCGKVVICSLNFAARMKDEIRSIGWNLVVIDEAHKLRNAHQPSNKTGQAIRFAVEEPRKILLTATPLQNSIMELFGMSSIIDEYMFGEPSVFRSLYGGADADLSDLKTRLRGFCKRTLRKDVLEYVQYTNRQAITRPFRPTDDEHAFYEAISSFLQRAETFSIPHRQRVLLTLRLRKILASSSPAIAGTLEIIRQRLIELKAGVPEGDLVDKVIAGEDLDEDDFLEESLDIEEPEADIPTIDIAKLEAEIQELDQYIRWARGIGVDTKSKALLSALEIGFTKMQENGAAKKALIFTESRRTQTYIRNFLEANGFAGKVATFNGSNNDEESKKLADRWVIENRGTGRVTGSRDVDARSAIIDHFKNDAEILVATEAAAEGVNLQFCSLVVNYDLPWNPQRIEQRIGRCHRYGQKHDVVVINFVNERNAADQRTFELLEEKFQLFDGVFGASDEVLGSIESGVDFEKRVYDIYQSCRTPDQIEAAFKDLREQLESSIQARMTSTRQLLLEFFDEEIHQRLRLQLEGTKQQLDRFGKQFWLLTKHVISDSAKFDDDELAFELTGAPRPDIKAGKYHLISKSRENVDGEFLYRLSHPLGEYVVDEAKAGATPLANVTFDISSHPTRMSVVEDLRGKSGWMTLDKLIIDAFEREEYILLSGFSDDGASIDQEVLEKMFLCRGQVHEINDLQMPDRLNAESTQHQKATMHQSFEANNRFMNEERERLENWADDMILSAEKELKDIKAQLRETNRQARQAPTTEEQLTLQNKIRDLEQKQRKQRQRIFEIEDEIIEKRDQLIGALEKRMKQKTQSSNLFTIRWRVV
ncbi:MAG: DEAD/DEAH box helicase [Fimbriimonadaceae bacterium]|nr:DEAD/DEAH box helicase [Fimbriimonadaceae bacterium]